VRVPGSTGRQTGFAETIDQIANRKAAIGPQQDERDRRGGDESRAA